MILQIILFACIGVAMEVVFTAASDFTKTRSNRLMGYSYIWMLPIYGLVPLFMRVLYPRLEDVLLPFRIVLYTVLLLIMEYATGWTLRKLTGDCPWEPGYRGKRWAIDGLVRLDYAPGWALACLIFERLYLALRWL